MVNLSLFSKNRIVGELIQLSKENKKQMIINSKNYHLFLVCFYPNYAF